MDTKEIDNILSNSSSKIIWLSCIDKERSLQQISQLWGYNYDTLYKDKTRDRLKEKGLVKVRKDTTGKLPAYFIRSNLDWLADYNLLEKGKGFFALNPGLIPFLKKSRGYKLEVLRHPSIINLCFNAEWIKQKFTDICKPIYENPYILQERKKEGEILKKIDWVILVLSILTTFQSIKKIQCNPKLLKQFKALAKLDFTGSVLDDVRIVDARSNLDLLEKIKRAGYSIPDEILGQ